MKKNSTDTSRLNQSRRTNKSQGRRPNQDIPLDPGLDKHTSLPYLWYSGTISEDQFMRTAHAHLNEFNELFELNEREETKLKDPKSGIKF